MSIAIFNGFPFHYEMFGYIIDYCKKNSIKLDIYTNQLNDIGWLKFYENYFNCNYIDYTKFQYENEYDKIILLTDDDRRFLNKGSHLDKTICIDHSCFLRNKAINIHIGTRFYTIRPSLDWILPVYRLINVKEKVNNSIIVCIGSSIPKNFTHFINFTNYKFIFIDRRINEKTYEKYDNITCYNSLDTSMMIEILKKSSYVLISDIDKEHMCQKISAAIPLALNCLCTLIIPKKMNDIYKFKSTITYEDKINLIEPNVELVNEDLDDLLKHRDSIFNKYLLTQKA
jgi:hypothetical protein